MVLGTYGTLGTWLCIVLTSVVDPEPDPKLFAGSGSGIIHFGSGYDEIQFLVTKIAWNLLSPTCFCQFYLKEKNSLVGCKNLFFKIKICAIVLLYKKILFCLLSERLGRIRNFWNTFSRSYIMLSLLSRTSDIKQFVLDEADEMLSRDFKDQIYDVFRHLNSEIQVRRHQWAFFNSEV